MSSDKVKSIYEDILEYRKVLTELVEADPNFIKKEIFEIRGTALDELKTLYNKLDENKKLESTSKGKILEEIAKHLFIYNRIYEVKTNLRDSSNEIDLLIKLNELGSIEKSILPNILQSNPQFIIECKNYKKNIGVTWIGKFYSLLTQRDLKMGIIISNLPLAGKGEWHSAKGLVKKIYLKDGIVIINICKSDILKIINHETDIITLINKKYEELRYFTDLDIDKNKSKHPAE